NWGGILWSFDNNKHMGQVLSSPTVVDIYRNAQLDNTSREELVIFTTQDINQSVNTQLLSVRILDADGNEVEVQSPTLVNKGDKIVGITISDGLPFEEGDQVYLTRTGSGDDYDVLGDIASVTPDGAGRVLLRFTAPHKSAVVHDIANTTV